MINAIGPAQQSIFHARLQQSQHRVAQRGKSENQSFGTLYLSGGERVALGVLGTIAALIGVSGTNALSSADSFLRAFVDFGGIIAGFGAAGWAFWTAITAKKQSVKI